MRFVERVLKAFGGGAPDVPPAPPVMAWPPYDGPLRSGLELRANADGQRVMVLSVTYSVPRVIHYGLLCDEGVNSGSIWSDEPTFRAMVHAEVER